MAKNKIHVFWSGAGAKEEAQKFAVQNGYVILEMTKVADYMERILTKQRREITKNKDISREVERDIWFQRELPQWEKLSREYAQNTPHQEVHVFINVSYKEPETMLSSNSVFKEKIWLNDFYYGWHEEDFIKFRSCFPDNEIPKSMKECCYDRHKSVLHRVEHPILKKMGKSLTIHYVKK